MLMAPLALPPARPRKILGTNSVQRCTGALGGYAKFNKDDAFKILNFSKQTGFTFEPVYSGKMILALLDLIEQGFFPKGHRIVILHTGGLQGIGGLIERNLLSADDWAMPKIK